MAKLINLNVYPANNIICVWNENNQEHGFQCGILLDDAKRGFMIPRYIIVGVFSDGTTKSAGIFSYSDLNDEDNEEIFLYDEFLEYVDIDAAKAFVRCEVNNKTIEGGNAKAVVLSELMESGVEISEEAKMYLISK